MDDPPSPICFTGTKRRHRSATYLGPQHACGDVGGNTILDRRTVHDRAQRCGCKDASLSFVVDPSAD